ncbi:hypothetical protein LSAT2_023277 [Lamellibrachia satsuma]|nr:hypothetical protein LSAT2_023277 [Lamellibrachia satsuma]
MSDMTDHATPLSSRTPSHYTDLKSFIPIAPRQNMITRLKQSLEQQLDEHDVCQKATSPGLARLRMTPGTVLKEKQQQLTRMHQDAKSRSDRLNIGGGVTIWPEMDNMRLSRREILSLILICCGLVVMTTVTFRKIHGKLLENLVFHYKVVSSFHLQHPLIKQEDNVTFTDSVLKWHTDFTSVINDVHETFDVAALWTSFTYQLYVCVYITGMITLIYYLADNIFSKSKLTPRRIKIWMSLLVVLGLWTMMVLYLLVHAQRLEGRIEATVHALSQQLADLVYLKFDMTTYHNVLMYWQTRCLPPTSPGMLTVMGMFPLKDVSYYLQYYSLPVLVALLTPVVKLLAALKDVYCAKLHA